MDQSHLNELVADEDFKWLLAGDEHEEFEAMTPERLEDQSRWSVYKSRVFRHKPTGRYFELYWGEGATEYQDGQDEPWSFNEVEPEEVTVTIFKLKKSGLTFSS